MTGLVVRQDVDGIDTPVGLDPRQVPLDVLKEAGHTGGSLLDIIRANCHECVDSQTAVRLCAATKCKFWPYRMGTDPFRKRELTEEQRIDLQERGQKLAKRAADARAKKGQTPNANPSVFKVGDELVTVKQREAIDIIVNNRGKLDTIHGKTLGSMGRSGWVNLSGEKPVLTTQGDAIARELGLLKDA